jgi:phage FluMu protein Com
MPIQFRCTQCQRLLRTADGSEGKQAKCPQCGAVLTIPKPGGPDEAPAAAPPSAPAPEEGYPLAGDIPGAPAGPSQPETPFAGPPGYPPAPGPGFGPDAHRPPWQQPAPYGPPARPTEGKAVASLVLGIISLLRWCCPLLGLPIAGTGLVLGMMSLKSGRRGMAIAGVVLSGIGLALALANAIYGAMLAASGQHPAFQ